MKWCEKRKLIIVYWHVSVYIADGDLRTYYILFTADVAYFRTTIISLKLPTNAVAGEHVFDMTSLIVVDRVNFVKSHFSFIYGYYGYYLSKYQIRCVHSDKELRL